MENAPSPLLMRIARWSEPAQRTLWQCRAMFHGVAEKAGAGPLDETLKWGQPSWRPMKPRTGSTLRIDWTPKFPNRLSLYVDCKTDLAARMQTLYPDLPENDGQRHLAVALDVPLPEHAIAHLAEMTFTYHRAKGRMAP
ncbi:hypothetical protein [Sulfitobacter sp. MF3-043]|uniref:hypothetical protein n=1 Tax=Sulfitobacter sediminivivens TaxID=3252902 RepID=UPI0036D7CA65